MPTVAPAPPHTGVDEFEALEQRVLRTVQLIKQEREARAAAEATIAELRSQLDARGSVTTDLEAELSALRQERNVVRGRVEKLMNQLDDLAS